MDVRPATTIPEFVERIHTESVATIREHAEPYALIEEVNALFIDAINLESLGGQFIRVFFGMTHAAYLSAAALGASGQLPPMYMVARGCIETAVTGFYLARHSELRQVWFDRNNDEASRKLAREAFWPAKLKNELKEANPSVGQQWEQFYEASIDYGAHPNVLGFWSGYDPSAGDCEGAWHYLQTRSPLFRHALVNVAYAGATALFTMELPVRNELFAAGITTRLIQILNRLTSRM